MRREKLAKRIFWYFVGLFIMTAGIALSVKSDLGVSPVSSIPYAITKIFGIELGNTTIMFHCFLVLVQVIMLRKEFKIISLLQVPVGIVFGKFTTFCNVCLVVLPTPENMAVRIILTLISIVLIAIGIFFYMPADIMPLAAEGCMQAMSRVWNKPFPKMKIAFDITVVLISLIACLVVLHSLGSVGIGTVMAAVLVGAVLNIITKKFGAWRDEFLAVRK